MRPRPLAVALAVAALLAGCTATDPASAVPTTTARTTSADGPTEPARVDTVAGPLLGYTDRGVHTFRGVPYARAERFAEAVDVPAWTGVRPALVYGPTCPSGTRDTVSATAFVSMTGSDLPQSEDCLVANVWTTTLDPGAARPVIVWIHGGGYSTGASNELAFTDGHDLAATGDAVVVSVNHRLNVLGYADLSAAGEEHAATGNLGQLDLVHALRWVQQNIDRFGGDPGNVTVVGQSGGGGKVLTLLGMPQAAGLIDRAVVLSPVSMWRTSAEARAQSAALLAEAGTDDPADLVDLPYADLLAAADRAGFVAGPVIDGDVLPAATYTDTGGFSALAADVPLLVTTTLGEFASNIAGMTYAIGDQTDPLRDVYLPGLTDARVDELLTDRFGDLAPAVADAFTAAYSGHPLADVLFMEDGSVFGGTRVAIASAAAARVGGAPVYTAVFAQDLPVFGGVTPPHTAGDLPLLLGTTARTGHLLAGAEAEFAATSALASGALLAFAATGDPSTDALDWPPYTAADRTTMVFDTVSGAREQHEVELYRLFAEARGD
jgi:para-nitrobenzyl esterase